MGAVNGHTLIFQIDNNIAYVEGEPYEMEVSPKVINARTFVPVRFIAEAIGFDVDWNGSAVVITK